MLKYAAVVPGAGDAGAGAGVGKGVGGSTLGSALPEVRCAGTLGSAAPGTEGSASIRGGLKGGTCLTGTLGSGLAGSE